MTFSSYQDFPFPKKLQPTVSSCFQITFRFQSSQRVTALKFSFSVKTTKMCAILFMVLTFTKVKVKTIRRMAKKIVAFSEKLNFKPKILPNVCFCTFQPDLKVHHMDSEIQF